MGDTATIIRQAMSDAGMGGGNDGGGEENTEVDNSSSEIDNSADETADGGESEEQQETETSEGSESSTEQEEESTEGEDGENVQPKQPVVEEDAFAKEHGLPQPKKGKRDNPIPYSNVKKIAANAEKKAFKTATGLDVPEGKTVAQVAADFKTTYDTLKANHDEYESRLDNVDRAEQIMQNEPLEYLRRLAQVLPDIYADLLAPVLGGKQNTNAGGNRQPEVGDEMPEADIDLGDGKKTYSPQAWNKRLAWERAQGVKETLAMVEKKYGKVFASHEANDRINIATQRFAQHVQFAEQNWDGFKDNKDAILKTLPGSKLTLEGAYAKFMIDKGKKDLAAAKLSETEMRKKIQKELQQTPGSTSAGGTGTAGRKPESGGKPLTTQQIIKREVDKKLKHRAA